MPSKVRFTRLNQDDNMEESLRIEYNNAHAKADISSDEEDEDVFIKESVNGGDLASTKPLMHPRKPRSSTKVRVQHGRPCRMIFRPVLVSIVSLVIVAGLVFFIVYLVESFTKHWKQFPLFRTGGLPENRTEAIIGCSNIEVEDVWVRGIPKLITESAIRLVDVNEDGVLDVLFGFGTGADGYNIPDIVCDIYFNGSRPCFGGLLCLDGRTGEELWRHYTDHELFALQCNVDFDGDGVRDCLGSGRAGAFELISTKTGSQIWKFGPQPGKDSIMNVYTAQPIKDYNGDGVPEVLVMHGGDPIRAPGSKEERFGRLMIFSGKDGTVLQWDEVPDGHESYYSSQLHTLRDGTEVVLYGTGGETHGGSYYYVLLDDVYKGNIQTKSKAILHDDYKGFMTPPALVDLNSDGVEDIVIVAFNSTLTAIDGQTFKTIWKYHVPSSESYNTPAVGYFNDDDIPDLMVHFSVGPGFPIYYYSVTFIIDGKTGKRLTDEVKDSVGAQASPLAISIEGHGNDVFLYWIADCEAHKGQGGQYTFLNGTNVHEQSRSDFCKLRFKTKGYTKYLAFNQHMELPGKDIYYSTERNAVEHSQWVNTTEEGLNFLRQHPEYLDDYVRLQNDADLDEKQKPYYKFMNGKDQDEDYDQDYMSMKSLLKGIMDREEDGRPVPTSQGRRPYEDMETEPQGLLTSPPDGQRGRYMESEAGRNPVLPPSPTRHFHVENQGNWRRRPIHRRPGPGSVQKRSLDPSEEGYAENHGGLTLNNDFVPFLEKPKSQEEQKESLRMFAERMDKLRDQLAKTEPVPEVQLNRYNDARNSLYASARWGGAGGRKNKNRLKGRKKQKNRRKGKNRDSVTITDVEVSEEIIDDIDSNAARFTNRRKNIRKNRGRKKGRKHRKSKDEDFTQSKDRGHRKHKRHAGVKEDVLNIEIRDDLENFLDGEQPRMEAQMRKRRHVGPHDQEGLQRLLSTGTIAPTLLPTTHPDYHHSVDVIFATYWFFPAKTQALLPEDQKCIEDFMKQETIRFDPKSEYYGMDHDAYGHAATHECLEKSGHNLPENGTYESQTSFNPFNVHMGQMTVYRIRLVCTCKGDKKIEKEFTRCSRILPHDRQQWSGYMGSYGNCKWKPRFPGRRRR